MTKKQSFGYRKLPVVCFRCGHNRYSGHIIERRSTSEKVTFKMPVCTGCFMWFIEHAKDRHLVFNHEGKRRLTLREVHENYTRNGYVSRNW